MVCTLYHYIQFSISFFSILFQERETPNEGFLAASLLFQSRSSMPFHSAGCDDLLLLLRVPEKFVEVLGGQRAGTPPMH